MKNTLALLFLFLSASLQAQIKVSAPSDNNKLTMVQVLTGKDCNALDKFSYSVLTEETSVQLHDGKVAYKTVREVEYLIKAKGKKITKKRKVLNTKTDDSCPKAEAGQIFPDMTATLLSSVLSDKEVKRDETPNRTPFAFSRKDDGSSIVCMDKLALMKAKGMETHVQNMGADIEFVEVAEKLVYHSSDEHLYIDDLQQIVSTYAVVSKEKSGSTHKVEVKETICIKSLTK